MSCNGRAMSDPGVVREVLPLEVGMDTPLQGDRRSCAILAGGALAILGNLREE